MFELGTHKTQAVAQQQERVVRRHRGLLLGLQQHQGPGGAPGDDGQHRRPAGQRRSFGRPTATRSGWSCTTSYKGKIDADFGKLAFTTPPLAAYHSVDAKFTTTDMAKELKTWALFGPPLGRTWQPTFDERQQFPEIQPLVSNPWTVLHAAAPAGRRTAVRLAVDLHDPEDGQRKVESGPAAEAPAGRGGRRNADAQELPAWHGTLLPTADADTWLVTGFADYEQHRGDGERHARSAATAS